MNIEWTDERVEQLRSLWTDGASATAIGKVMHITRNAVLGKRFRLKLDGRIGLNDTHYGPRIRKPNPRSVFKMRERKPRLRIPNPGARPHLTATQSPITGAFLATVRKPRVPEMTKPQLRAMLTQAVLNTGGTR